MQNILRLLVLDDEPAWQERIKTALQADGWQVDVVGSYAEAMDQFPAVLYSLAIVDIRLGTDDDAAFKGFEWVDMLRRLRQPLPVLFLCEEGDDPATLYARLEHPAFAFQAADVLAKAAFDADALRRHVREVLSRVFYVSALLDTEKGAPLFVDQPYTLTLTASKNLPGVRDACALLRPASGDAFDLEIDVQPFDIDVLSGSRQTLRVSLDDDFNPLRFHITPRRAGRVEVVIDLRGDEQPPARMVIGIDVTGSNV